MQLNNITILKLLIHYKFLGILLLYFQISKLK